MKSKSSPKPMFCLQHRAREQLELVHGELCNPVTPTTPGRRHYFLLLVDDASCFIWAILLQSKDATIDTIKQVQATAKRESGHQL